MESRAILLGKYIRKQRKKRFMTMSDLSNLCDLSVSHISRIEKGVDSNGKEISPSLDVIERISRALNININDLLVDSGYVSYQEMDDNPLYPLLYEFLSNPKIIAEYNLHIDVLDEHDLKEAYQILLNAIDLISLKYKQ